MAIQKLIMKNVTVFDEITLDFSSGVNVFIGSNGVGKTHIMKMLYSACQAVRHDVSFPHKVVRTFRPDKSEISRLVRRDGTSGKHTASVLVESEDAKIGMTFASDTKKWDADDVNEEEWEKKHSDLKSVFIPAKEMLSHSYKLTEAVAVGNVEFDETYIDHIASAKINITTILDAIMSEIAFLESEESKIKTGQRSSLIHHDILQKIIDKGKTFVEEHSVALEKKYVRSDDEKITVITPELENVVDKLQKTVGGSVNILDEHFYLDASYGKLEFNLLSEGLRKIALLWQLIQNGALKKGSVLFWDEPEANLNPEHIPMIADLLLLLQREGVQVFVSTHDYFLSKYLDGRAEDVDEIAFFSFYKEDGGVQCEKQETFLELDHNPIMDTFMALYHEEVRRGME